MTSPSRRKRIHVVDGDRRAGDALAKALAPLGYEVRIALSAAAFAAATLPDVDCCVLIDVSFNDQSGFELQQHLIDSGSDAGIVFMTAHADIPMAVTTMKRGAVDFLAKPLRMSELLPAVDAALLRSARRRAARRRHAEFSERVARLTPREREVLALVLEGKRNKQIADALASQESTVKVHRSRLMRKLEIRSLAELLRVDAELGRSIAAPSADTRWHERSADRVHRMQ